jgi:hypothetical protein
MKKSWQSNIRKSPAAQRTSRDGTLFASKAELIRWEELRLQEKAGMIRNLSRQVRYDLILPNGKPIMAGVAAKRVAVYTPDFVYDRLNKPTGEWQEVIEDVKGHRDKASQFRIRVFEAIYSRHVTLLKYEHGRWTLLKS